MVFSKFVKLMAFSWLEFVTLGDQETGQESSAMRMKLGTTIRVLKISLIINSRVMEIGGWSLMIFVLISVKYIYARFSQRHGHSTLLMESGVETQLVVHTHSKMPSRKLKTQKIPSLKQSKLIRIIDGSTTHSIAFQSKRRPPLLLVSCRMMRRYLRETTSQLISWS